MVFMSIDCDSAPRERKTHWVSRWVGRGFVRPVGLVSTLAIALSSGLSVKAQTQDLPKVSSGAATASSPVPVGSPSTSASGASQGSASKDSLRVSPAPKRSSVAATQDAVRQDAVRRAPKTDANAVRFFCQLWKGQYTVMYSPESRTGESYPWAVPQDLGGGWVAEKRCTEISRRLEEYRPDGLKELSTTTENGYNTVCATTESNGACRIVFTVPPGQDPISTRNSVFESLATADSGQMTQGVNTFVGSNSGTLNLNGDLVNLGLAILGNGSGLSRRAEHSAINLKPFLAPSDGGSGIEMTNGVRLQKGLRLNPNRFR